MKYIANPVIVEAFRIVAIDPMKMTTESDHAVMPLELEGGRRYNATREQLARIIPKVGDYVVTQSDGYAYLNPKDVFERKYAAFQQDHELLSFGWAIEMMRLGHKVGRKLWPRGQWIELVTPENHLNAPYLSAKMTDYTFFPWTPNTLDLLANDWRVVEP